MIWVAVCDRDPQRRQQTGRLAARYLENRRGVSGRVALFANSDEMGRCGQLRFDICLMNVEAPLHLEAGKELRWRCPETALLYYSSTQDPAWALEAFRAGASQYLPYPLEERSLWLAMDRAAWERDLGREILDLPGAGAAARPTSTELRSCTWIHPFRNASSASR